MLPLRNFVVVVSFLLVAVRAQNDLDLSYGDANDDQALTENDLEGVRVEKIQELMSDLQLLLDTGDDDVTDVNANCRCSGLKCSCCQKIRLTILKLDDYCCLSIEYLPRNFGILMVLTFGSRTLFSKEISAKNPPPVCVGIPYLKKGASTCIQFYNLNVGNKVISGCSKLLIRLFFFTIFETDLGCFRMNFVSNNATEEALQAMESGGKLLEKPVLDETYGTAVQPLELPADGGEVLENSKALFFVSRKFPVEGTKRKKTLGD